MKNSFIIILTLGIFFFVLPSSTFAANRYWVGSSGGATNDDANWAAADPASCTGGGASAPSTGDVAIFDADCDNNASVTGTFSVQGVSIVSGYTGTISQNAVAMTIGSAGWVQAGGTFTGNSDGSTANITLDSGGDHNQTGGTFTSTNDIFTINDEWNFSGGTFTHNSGTVTFTTDGDTASTLTGSATFNNLTFDPPGSNFNRTITIASGTILTTDGTLALTSVSANNNHLNGPGQIYAKGDINVTGEGWPGNALIIVNGTGSQTITGESDVENYLPAIQIDKSSGTLTLANKIAISDDWIYTQGTLSPGTSTVTFTTYQDGQSTISGSFTLANVTFDPPGSEFNRTFTLSSGAKVISTGTLTLSSVDSSGSAINGPGTIEAQGNLVSSGDGWPGNVAISLTGSAAQTITLSGSFPTGTFSINKTSGTATLATNLTLSGSGQDLLISRGTLDLATYTLTVNDTITVSGGGVLKSYSGGDIVVGSGGLANAGQVNLGNPQTCGAADSSAITSSSGGAARTWSGNGLVNLYDVAITDQTESPFKGNGVIWSGTNNGNTNFRVLSTCPTPANAHWQFDEGQGTSANDSSPNANTGTLAGTTVPAWRTEDQCVSGKCLFFDGSTSNVTVANVIKQVRTVSIWVKPSSVADIALIDLDGGTHRITVSSGTITATGFTSPTIYVNGVVTSTLTANQWQLVTVTTGTAFNSTSSLTIGKYTSGSKFFPGFIDSPKIYNYVLSTSQIKSDFLSKGANDLAGTVLGVNTQNNAALSNGLVGYWKLDETATPSVDSSGNSYNGTWGASAGSGAGKFGNALSLDATNNSYVSNTSFNGISSVNRWAVSVWFKTSDTDGYIYDNRKTSNNFGVGLYTDGSNTLQMFVQNLDNASYYKQYTYSVTSTNNAWHHAVLTRDGDNSVVLYIDGVRLTPSVLITDNNMTGVNETWSALVLGHRYASNIYNYNGLLDEYRIYNRALSSAEVSQLYNWAPGPVGYWKLDEKSGTTMYDSSGNGLNGTASNSPVVTQGKYDGALTFSGANSGTNKYINVTSSSDLIDINLFTLSAWVNPSTFADYNQLIDSQQGLGTQNDQYNLYLKANNEFSTYLSGAGECTSTPTGSLTANTWAYISSTYDGSSVRLYKNGVLVNTCSLSRSAGNNDNIVIGARSASQYATNSKLDEVKIYNYPRTTAQIVEDMNGGHPAPGSPVGTPIGSWNFNEGFSTTANNRGSGGSSLNGTLTSMASPATSTSGWTNSGKIGKALGFDGTNDYVTMGTSTALAVNGPLTVSAWVNPTSFSGGTHDNAILGRFDDANSRRNYLLYTDSSGQLLFQTSTNASCASGGSVTLSSGVNLATGTWSHVAGVYDGTYMHTYINGKEVGTPVAQSSICTSETSFAVGMRYGGGSIATGSSFTGFIDEPKFYAQALTSDQIKLDMNQSSAQVVGSLSSTQSAPNAASSIYCIPGDVSTCTGPVGEWNFDEGSGSSANDSSGNSNTGTWTGTATRSTGRVNKAANLDGSTNYITAPASSFNFGTGSFTVETWIKTTQSAGANLVDKYSDDTTRGYRMHINNSAGKASWQLFSTGSSNQANVTSTTTINDGRWHHVVGVRNGTTNQIYVDGKLEDSTTGASADVSGTNLLALGARSNDGSSKYNGMMDQTKIFDYARTAAQVAWDYNRGEPIAHWKMDECQGTTINDASGNSFTGTLTNASAGTCTTSGAWFNGVSGKRNNSVDLDTDDYIQVTDNANLRFDDATADFSLFAWVKRASNGEMNIISKEDADNDGYRLQFTSGNVLRCSVDAIDIDSTLTITDTNWHFVGCTIDRDGNGQIYLDGQANGTATAISSEVMANTANLRLGARSYTTANYLDGQIDDARIYNHAITSIQVMALYNDNSAYRTGPATGAP